MASQPEYLVEKGIPILNEGWSKYPFHQMEVGDSFLVPADRRGAVSVAATKYGRQNSRKYTVRKVDGGYRAWRVA